MGNTRRSTKTKNKKHNTIQKFKKNSNTDATNKIKKTAVNPSALKGSIINKFIEYEKQI